MSVSEHQLLVDIVGRLDANLTKAFATLNSKLKALTAQIKSLNTVTKEMPKSADKATQSQTKLGKSIDDSSTKVNRYSQLVKKFGKDTESGLQAARPLFKAYAQGAEQAGESLEQANRRATNMVRGLATMQNQLTQTNEKWARWGERTRAVQIRQAELNGHIRATAQGIQILNPLALKNLNLTQQQAKAIGYYTDRNAAFHKSLMQVAQATKGNQAAFVEKEKALLKADDAIRKTAQAMTRAGKDGDAFARTANRGRIAFQMMTGELKTTNGVLTPTAQKLGLVAKQGTLVQRVIGSVAESFKSMARYAAGAMVFYQLFNVFRTGVKAIIDFSQGMRDLQAIINATDDDMRRLAETTKQVAADTKYSTTEVADGMKLLGQAGLDASEIMSSIQHVAELATGTMSDFAMVSDLVTTTVRAFQMDFRETGNVVDVFANAINRSKLTVDKLRVAFNYIAPFAHAAGISFEETTGSLMQLANAGIRASTMGTGFRQILIRLLNPTATFKKAIEEAGYSVDDFNPRTQDLADIFDRLSVVVPSAAEAVQFFHVRSLPAVMVFASQGGDALRGFLDVISEVGAAARMMETQTKGLGIQFKQIADKFTVLSASLGQSGLEGLLLGLTITVRKFLDILIFLANKGFTSVIIQVGVLVGVLKTLQAAFLALRGPAIATALFGWGAGIKGLIVHITALTTAIITQTGVTKAATAAWLAFNRVLLANKFIAVATAIVAVIGAYRNFSNANENAKIRLEDKKNALRDTIAVMDLYVDKLEEAQREEKGTQQIINRLIHELPELANEIRMVNIEGGDLVQWLKDMSAEKTVQVMTAVGQQAALALKDIEKFGFRLEIWKGNLDGVSTVLGEIKNPINSLLKRLGFLDKAIEKNTLLVEKNKAQFREYVLDTMTYLRQQGDSFEGAREKIKNILRLSGVDLQEHAEFIDEVFAYVEASIKSFENATIESFRQMPKILDDLKDKYSDVADDISKSWEQTLNSIELVNKELEDNMIDEEEAKKRILNIMRELTNSIHELTGEIHHFMHASENLDRFLMNATEEFNNFFKTLSGSELQDLAKAIDDASDSLKEMEEWLRKVLNLSEEQIKDIIDEEWGRRQLEILMKFSEEFRNRYRTHLDIIKEMEDRHTEIQISRLERQVEANKRTLDRRLEDVKRNADQEIAYLDLGAKYFAQIQASKLEHLRQAEIQKVQIIQGGVLKEQSFLNEAKNNFVKDIYDRVEVVRGGQLTIEKFLKEGVTAFEKAEYEKTYALKGIEDEKRRIRQEAFDQQLKLVHGHYVKEMELVSQMEDALLGNYDKRWQREQGYWEAKGKLLGDHLDTHLKTLNTEETMTARSQAELVQIRLRTFDRYIQAHQNYLSNLEGMLSQERSHHQNTVNEIINIRKSLIDDEIRKYDKLREIAREYMTDEQKLADSRMEYENQMAKARAAIAVQDYEAAKKHVDAALRAAGEIKKEDEDKLTRQQRIIDAENLLAQAKEDQINALEKEAEASKKRMEDLEASIQGVTKRLEEIQEMKFQVEVENITESVARAEEEIEKIRKRLEAEPIEMDFKINTEEAVKEAVESTKEVQKTISDLEPIVAELAVRGEGGEELKTYFDNVKEAFNNFWEEFKNHDSVITTIFFKGSGSEELPLSEKLDELKQKFDDFVAHIIRSEDDDKLAVLIEFKGHFGEEKPLLDTFNDVAKILKEFKNLIEEPIQMAIEFVSNDGSTSMELIKKLDILAYMFEYLRSKVEEAIVMNVYTKEAMEKLEELQKKIDSIPKETKSTHTVNVIGIDLLEKVLALHQKLNGMSTSSTHTVTVRRVQASNTGGEIGFDSDLRGYATGGYIPEGRFSRKQGAIPGRGTKDDVPAMLTKGEYVQPVSTVDYYGKGFMEALRQKLIPKDALPKFATGGYVHKDSVPHFYTGGPIEDQQLRMDWYTEEYYRRNFPRLYETLYGTKSTTSQSLKINIPSDVNQAIKGGGHTETLQNEFQNYLDRFNELGLNSSSQLRQKNTDIMSIVSELATGMIDRGNMSDTAIKRYDFASETIVQDLRNQADYLRDQGLEDIAFKVDELAYDLQNLLHDYREKIIQVADDMANIIQRADETALQMQTQLENQIASLEEQKRRLREEGKETMYRYHRTVYGGYSLEMYRDLNMYSPKGMEAIRQIRDMERQVNATRSQTSSNYKLLEQNTQRQVDSLGSLVGRYAKKTSLDGGFTYRKAEHDLNSYMHKAIRDFRELEIQARRELQNLVGRDAPKVGVSHWLNKGGLIDYSGNAKRGVDSVLAKLTPGEFVIREPIVQKLGVDFFEKLNKHGVAGFNQGGLVTQQSSVPNTIDSGFNATVNINIGNKLYPAKMKEFDAREFVKSLKNAERRMH